MQHKPPLHPHSPRCFSPVFSSAASSCSAFLFCFRELPKIVNLFFSSLDKLWSNRKLPGNGMNMRGLGRTSLALCVAGGTLRTTANFSASVKKKSRKEDGVVYSEGKDHLFQKEKQRAKPCTRGYICAIVRTCARSPF